MICDQNYIFNLDAFGNAKIKKGDIYCLSDKDRANIINKSGLAKVTKLELKK